MLPLSPPPRRRIRQPQPRFHLLVPLVNSVLLRVDCIISDDSPDTSSPGLASGSASAPNKPPLFFVRFPIFSSILRSFVSYLLLNPIQSLGFLSFLPHRIPNSPSLSATDDCDPSASYSVTHHSPVQVLQNFAASASTCTPWTSPSTTPPPSPPPLPPPSSDGATNSAPPSTAASSSTLPPPPEPSTPALQLRAARVLQQTPAQSLIPSTRKAA